MSKEYSTYFNVTVIVVVAVTRLMKANPIRPSVVGKSVRKMNVAPFASSIMVGDMVTDEAGVGVVEAADGIISQFACRMVGRFVWMNWTPCSWPWTLPTILADVALRMMPTSARIMMSNVKSRSSHVIFFPSLSCGLHDYNSSWTSSLMCS